MAADAVTRPTKKQRALLDFIQAFIDQHGYSPSYREIMNGCGYSSIATVAVHINNLISRGHLRKRDHSARSLELTGSAVSSVAEDDVPPAQWVLSRLESLVVEAEAAVPVKGGSQALLMDIQQLVNALPILDIPLPERLAERIQRLMVPNKA